jgi:Gametolysin peptidase M11
MRRAAVCVAAALALLVGVSTADAGTLRTLAIRATWGPPLPSVEATTHEFQRADAFLRRSSFGKLDLRVDVTPAIAPFVIPAGCFGDGPGLGPLAETARAAAARLGYDVAAYDRFVYVFPDFVCGHGGIGSGADILLANPSGVDWVGFVHELGHTLGFPHATRTLCPVGCRIVEYGDPFSPMGAGAEDFSAWEKFNAGWITNVVRVSANGRYTLGSPQSDEGLPQALVVKTARGEYWVEDTRFDTSRLVVRVVRRAHANRTYVQTIYLGSGTQKVQAPGLFRVTRLTGSQVAFRWLGRGRG